MDNSDQLEQNLDESNGAGNEKDESQRRVNSLPYFAPKQNQSGRPHSRSRSPAGIRGPRQWRSSNAFVNFLHEFRKNFTGLRGTRIFQLAGDRWRQMSPEEKEPFARVAAGVRSRRANQRGDEEASKSNKNTERRKSASPTGKETKRIKKPAGNGKKRKQAKKKRNASDSDTDSATSGTAGSRTSVDTSNESS